jgi:peptidoglycan/xylan/chitin deacetylase (PgdA/CDA1 family)
MTVDPAVFARQVSYVKRYHTVVSLGEALQLLADGARLKHPVAVLTFDDAYRSVWREALPIMDAERVAGCCFVTTGMVEARGQFEHDRGIDREDVWRVMTWEELAKLQQRGWEIGGHSHTHQRLSAISTERLREELEIPLRILRDRLGIAAPIPMAVPFGGVGDINIEGRAAVRDSGYSACCSDYGGENAPPGDRFDIRRIELGGSHPTLAWKARSHGLDLAQLRAWMTNRSGRGDQG